MSSTSIFPANPLPPSYLPPPPRRRHLCAFAMAATKVGHGVANALGIKLNYRDELREEIRRGESVFSTQTAGSYVEEEPKSAEWVAGLFPSGPELVTYCRSLFPFLAWIGHYNVQWLIGDLVAGKRSQAWYMTKESAWLTERNFRYHHWCRCCAPGDGLCCFGSPASRVRALFVLYGSPCLLVLRNIQRYHHWCKCR